MTVNPIHVHHFNLKSAIQAFKTLYGREPKITAAGTFDTVDVGCCFGPVEVTAIRNKYFSYMADGTEWHDGIIESVNAGFYLTLED